MKCKHDWVKVCNIDKDKIWYCIFIYAHSFTKREKYVCLKCDDVRQ